MKYFNDFENISDKTGIIEIKPGYEFANIHTKDTIYNINGISNINRVFNNDTVEFSLKDDQIIVTNQLINSIKNKKIVGVLHIKTKTIIGVNKKNMPIYNFKPFDKRLPSFHVASNYLKKNKSNRNVYAIIVFNKWSIDCLHPIGICEEIIGEVGNLEKEKDLLFYLHNLNFKNYKNKDIIEFEKYLNDEKNFIKTDKDRIDLTKKKIFSIDPDGCKDIDDAIHIEKNNDNTYTIGVHIADVTSYINEGSNIDLLARNRFSTIYLHKRIDMIPSILSTEIASLHEGEIKRAVSVIYNINSNGDINNLICKRSFIKNNKAFTYDTIDNIINNKKKSEFLDDILDLKYIVDKISKKYNPIIQEIDSHSLIETLMILTNCSVANIIYKKYPKNTILRIHDGIDSNRWDNIYENLKNLDKEILNSIKILYTNAAKYEITSNIDLNKEILHIGLNKKYYTHFTSPIRRYIDIIIHRMLLNDDYKVDVNILEPICSGVNNYQKNIKKAERDFQKLCLLEKLLDNTNLAETTDYQLECIIIDIKKNNITIYIPKLKMSHTMNLLSKKLENMINYELKENDIIIINKQNNKKVCIKLFQEILVNITAMPYNDNINNKISTKIINPDIFNILQL